MLRLFAKTVVAVAALAVSACSHGGIGGVLPQQPRDNAQIIPVPEQSGGVPIDQQSLSFSGHLYVADAAGVQRFPVPTLTYSTAKSPIVVDASNRLYATNGLKVNVYATGVTTPARTLNIIVPSAVANLAELTIIGGVRSLAVDSAGHLYLGMVIRYCVLGSVGCSLPFYAKAAFIYAPNASGSPVPRIVRAVQCSASFTCFFQAQRDMGGLVLDSHGNLLVASVIGANRIYTIASPLTAPVDVRTISGSGVQNPAGLAVDTSGVLYADNPNGSHSFIAAFPVTANGSVVPTRVISVARAVSFGNGIAVGGGHLYIPDVSGNSVDEVSSLVGGTQTPLKLAVTSPEDVKLAP